MITMDCDFSHDPKVIPQLIAALASAVRPGHRLRPGFIECRRRARCTPRHSADFTEHAMTQHYAPMVPGATSAAPVLEVRAPFDGSLIATVATVEVSETNVKSGNFPGIKIVDKAPVHEEVHMGASLMEHGALGEFPVPISTAGHPIILIRSTACLLVRSATRAVPRSRPVRRSRRRRRISPCSRR